MADLAVLGLGKTYGSDAVSMPHTRRWNGPLATCHGRNVRYALISILGLARASAVVGPQDELVDTLWQRVTSSAVHLDSSPGDLGLGLWARALSRRAAGEFTAERALRAWRNRPSGCDSVESSWLLLGAEHAVRHGLDVEEGELLAEQTKKALLALYNPQTALFYRHAGRSVTGRVSRRVACFANQIYPVMALSVHARRTGCPDSASAATAASDKLCRAQGELGQWWWLYDVESGEVVDGFPVFSVHQDGMAPMALVEASAVSGRCYAGSIERGVRWIMGENEVGQSLVHREEGLICRDIHQRGLGRLSRMVNGTLWCCGWRGSLNRIRSRTGFDVNRECRPYHLGWILYAAALMAAYGQMIARGRFHVHGSDMKRSEGSPSQHVPNG